MSRALVSDDSGGLCCWLLYRVLKTGGEEILHDKWDEAAVEDPETPVQDVVTKETSLVLPDWTRVPMMVGAPHAGKHPPRQFGLVMQEVTPVG